MRCDKLTHRLVKTVSWTTPTIRQMCSAEEHAGHLNNAATRSETNSKSANLRDRLIYHSILDQVQDIKSWFYANAKKIWKFGWTDTVGFLRRLLNLQWHMRGVFSGGSLCNRHPLAWPRIFLRLDITFFLHFCRHNSMKWQVRWRSAPPPNTNPRYATGHTHVNYSCRFTRRL